MAVAGRRLSTDTTAVDNPASLTPACATRYSVAGGTLEAETTVAVIGAGPAGLAVGACLRRAGLSFVILEQERQLAPAWRRQYDRLHLHTIKQFSSLPFVAFPKAFPRYVPKSLMLEYLESYAANFDLRPRLGQHVNLVRWQETRWVVQTNSTTLLAPYLVIASGINAEPVIPHIPGIERFEGPVIHSAEYRNPMPYIGRSVLVVGMGNSGAEIALDLAEAGARPTVSIRNGVHIVPRELYGVPIQLIGMVASRALPVRANDKIFPIILDAALGNLAKYGITRPKQGLLDQIEKAKIPVIDVGTVRAIMTGQIKIAPAVVEITKSGARFANATTEQCSAVIFATGYRPSYQQFLNLATEETGAHPRFADTHLYFVGFRNSATGLLRNISKEALQAAQNIRRQLTKGQSSRAGTAPS